MEHALYAVVGSTEYEDKEIEGFKMKITNTTKSSVVVHLKSDDHDDRNARFIVENGIVNGDLTRFIGNLFDNESIKMHLSLEKKYRVSVSFESTTSWRSFEGHQFCKHYFTNFFFCFTQNRVSSFFFNILFLLFDY